MTILLAVSRLIDALNSAVGRVAEFLVLFCCLISAINATIRYLFNYSSNGWLEIQWYLFAFIVLMGASLTLKKNEHVRVDLFYGWASERNKLLIDIFGLILLLLPACTFLAWLSYPYFVQALTQGEMSSNAGGLIRWPVKLIIFLGFCLLTLQGFSELIKRIAALTGRVTIDVKYEKPLQ
jgi:TRAP-type mannitol/chloroaromatic compound transport system permease small subunit